MTEMDKVKRKRPSEQEIDRIVVEQADDDSVWEEPVRVRRYKAASLSFPGELIERASFLAKLHREKGAKEWLTRIIRERIELEELAFAQAKRELKEKHRMPNEGVKRTSDHT
ncbi:MAG: hypothetical protein RBS57_06440 [Desulforhabdus sp.]|nr:hypothetical protein [Desulforhabdus sp.]